MRPSKKIKPPTGTTTAEASGLPVYDSMRQASADTGIPYSLLRKAKRQGCRAFDHSRVHLGELLRWLFSRDSINPDVDWGWELNKVKTLREQIRLEKDKHQVVDRGLVRDGAQRIMAMMFGTLDRQFTSELPANLEGREKREIAIVCRDAIEELKETLRSEFGKMERGG